MILKYAAAEGILSVAAVMLLSPVIFRARQKSGVFSAAVGIILYTIVKSIFVECGWGFAAACGIYAGLFAETMMLGCGIAFFGELKKVMPARNGKACLAGVGVTLVMAGKNMLVNYMLVSDFIAFLIGRAAQFALLLASVNILSDAYEENRMTDLSVCAAICVFIGILTEVLAGQMNEKSGSAAAPILILAGCCSLTVLFSDFTHHTRELSAGGLAAGFMLIYGFDCLTV